MVKDGVFLFLISFLVPEIFTFLYYANLITDDVTRCKNIKSIISLYHMAAIVCTL